MKVVSNMAILASVSLLLAAGCGGGAATATKSGAAAKNVAVAGARPQPKPPTEAQFEQRIARLELQLVEREAQVEELQARLDDARREVVRGMAKMQTMATRAEAASGIAEAEIALGSLRAARAAQEIPEVSQLMRLSTAEFDKENYGGALYLANQAKSAAVAARGQLASVEQGSLRNGEVPFALPLRLKTSARANLRSGPGNGFAIVATLPAGSPLTGHAHAEQWVHVSDDAGHGGWVFQGLIERRP
jgi:uncharacterized coiled-coil protein SlyX